MKTHVSIIMRTFKVLFSILVLCIVFKVQAQPRKNYDVIDALDIYERAAEHDVSKGKDNPELFLRLAQLYYYKSKYDYAYKWYKRYYDLKNIKPKIADNYRYGQILKVKGEYDKADELLATYYEFKGLPYQAYHTQKKQSKADETISNKGYRYTISTFNRNTDYSDYPLFIRDNRLYISSLTPEEANSKETPNSDVLYIDLDDKTRKPMPIKGKVNTELNEGSLVITKDGNTMYFSRNDYIKGKLGKTKDDVVTINLYKAELVNGAWKKITPLPFNSPDYSIGHPALSLDEKTLYFTSDQSGTRGETDLYSVPIYEDGTYGVPKNMTSINTVAKEMFPFIDTDGVLYFASDREESKGGLDIFMSPLEADKSYQRVFSLGDQINSNYDDFAYVINKDRKGFYSSNRVNDIGSDDIYEFVENEKFIFSYFVELKGVAQTFDTDTPVKDIKITLLDKNRNPLETVTTEDDGSYKFKGTNIKKGAYIKAEKPGYQTLEKVVTDDILKDKSPAFVVNLVHTNQKIPEYITIKGSLKDYKTGKTINNATLTLLDIENNVIAKTRAYKNGQYKFDQVSPKQTVFVRAEKQNYQTQEQPLDIRNINKKVLNLDFKLVKGSIPMKPGNDLASLFNPIYFDYGKSEIRPDGYAELDKIIQVLKLFPNLTIKIGSYADSRSSKKFNLNLSKKRAFATYNYIVKSGIDRNRLTYKGYGESKLVNHCKNGVKCPEEAHQLNRRSSFVITKH